jgi:hypothetical protein
MINMHSVTGGESAEPVECLVLKYLGAFLYLASNLDSLLPVLLVAVVAVHGGAAHDVALDLVSKVLVTSVIRLRLAPEEHFAGYGFCACQLLVSLLYIILVILFLLSEHIRTRYPFFFITQLVQPLPRLLVKL